MAHRAVIRTPQGSYQIRNRVGVVETVFFQGTDQEAKAYDTRFHRWLNSRQVPYTNDTEVGEEWQPINTAHLKDVSYLILENLEGSSMTKIPSEQEIFELDKKLLLVSFGKSVASSMLSPQQPKKEYRDMHSPKKEVNIEEGFAYTPDLGIPPGETNRFSALDLNRIMVRAAEGKVTYRIIAYPA